jgi:hypothetical protein
MSEPTDHVAYDPFDSAGGQMFTWSIYAVLWAFLIAMMFGVIYATAQGTPGIIVAIMGFVAWRAQPWRK